MSEPTAPAKCPFTGRFPLPRQQPMNPPEEYAKIGETQPVRRVTQWNGAPAWFITGYANVRAMLADPRTSADASNPSYPAQSAALKLVRKDYQVFAQMDPPGHTEERKLFSDEFSVRRVEELRPKVQALIDARIDRMIAKGPPADLVADFASPLPCDVICTLLGVPESDHAAIQGWAREISSTTNSHEQAAAMQREFCEGYLTDLVRAKIASPGDDLLSWLVTGPLREGVITEHKVVSLARLMLTAGHESTTGTLGLGLAALLYHPDQLTLLQNDPKLIRGAVEEILRYTDVTHSGRLRVAKEDIELCGVTIRAGDAIIMHQATGDRDPSVFPDPHKFDITRKPRAHLAFGFGIHQCIGQPLARMELQEAIGTLVLRLPGLKALRPMEELNFHHKLAIYGLESLPAGWD